MTEFAGWELPLQYESIVEEHRAVRAAAGLFDVSHMGKLLIEGPGAHAGLDRLSANEVPRIPGTAKYTHLLREDATILDDAIVTCLSPSRLFVVCNAGPRERVAAWFRGRLPPEVGMQDVTETFACLALQGPRAPGLLARLAEVDAQAMHPFAAGAFELVLPGKGSGADGQVPVEPEGWGTPGGRGPSIVPDTDLPGTSSAGTSAILVTRTGYTGEPGFELFPPASRAYEVWEALLAEGAKFGARPIGLGARDTLRLEKGFLLSGQDFDGRQTPLEVNCAWLVKWERAFVGKDTLIAQRLQGDYRRLVGIRMDDRAIPRPGHIVKASGKPIGIVTSGTLSTSLRVGIALAPVDRDHARPGAEVRVDVRGTEHPAHVVRTPFL